MNRISESLRVVLWSSVFIYVVVCSLQITQVDIWWQLSEGDEILRTFHLPTAPVFAFGPPASPYFDEYAGYEIILALIFKATGFPGLWISFIIVYLMILFLPSLYSRSTNAAYDIFSSLALLTAGILLKDRLEQRPELVGSLLQVLLMLWLRKGRLAAVTLRASLPLLIIFVIWTNTHSNFLFGVFTLGLWIACEIALNFRTERVALMIRNGFSLLALAFVALSLNPYGLERFSFPFRQAFDPGSTALSPEMWPILAIGSVPGISWLAAVLLLAWALSTSRTTPLWLVLFSFFAAYMTLRHYRWASLMAIALVFVYAGRDAQLKSTASHAPLLVVLRVALLAFLGLFMIFGDAYSFVFTYREMRGENRFATNSNKYAPGIVKDYTFASGPRPALLCSCPEGSYLSFDEVRSFRPFLDSGMSHFSDDTKRYFFFIWHEPEAFAIALSDLRVNYVMTNFHTVAWILTIERTPGWKMLSCSPSGILWQRVPGGAYVPEAADRALIAGARDSLLSSGDSVGAFCYSTLLGQDGDSLALLSESRNDNLPETFFNYLQAWVSTLSQAEIEDFLAHRDAGKNVVLDGLLQARLGPESYHHFAATVSPEPDTLPWKIVKIRNELAGGNRREARNIFDSLPTTQPSSVVYYELWHDVRDDAGAKETLNGYGQWQTWDGPAKEFMKSMSARISDRIDQVSGEDASQLQWGR